MLTINPQVQTSMGHWYFAWEATVGPYYVYYQGQRVGVVTATEFQLFEPDGSVIPVIEVSDDAAELPAQQLYPGRAVVSWYGADEGGIAYYRMEQMVGEEWEAVDAVGDDGRGYFEWSSGWLEDVTEHGFRIVPVGGDGVERVSVDVGVMIVRNPDVPVVVCSYDGLTGDVTVG